jgi:AcrR family transcriptional regulator
MPKVSAEHIAERRERILDAAAACIRREGLRNMTMRHIYAEAGVSAGAVYNYFPHRHDIVRALAERLVGRQEMRAARLLAAGSATEALRVVLRDGPTARALAADADEMRMRLDLWAELVVNPELAGLLRTAFERSEGILARLVGAAQAEGGVRPGIDPRAAARAVIALHQGVVVQAAAGTPPDAEPFLRAIELMLLPETEVDE